MIQQYASKNIILTDARGWKEIKLSSIPLQKI
jgi:hypothetical protein